MDFDDRYSWTDRLLHRLAFRLGIAQRTLADIEETLYGDVLQAVSNEDPVFISSLPRAGTTILLRLLWNTGRFGTHTYRDMPFVMAPILWRRFSQGFASEETTRERAHGDGIEISERSPEAFEEMIWKHFWPQQYRADYIVPWEEDNQSRAFNTFFETHMRKIIALHQTEEDNPPRYLSKNNLNIARLGAPPPGLRKGIILIPFREPIQQAASMHRQHRRFLSIHEDDDFVREYMEAIGHHEFGKGLKPVNVGNWLQENPGQPETLPFWLRYWTKMYQFILHNAQANTVLISYHRLTHAPERSLKQLADILSLPTNACIEQADLLRPPRTHSVDEEALPSALRRTAEAVYEDLNQRARI